MKLHAQARHRKEQGEFFVKLIQSLALEAAKRDHEATELSKRKP